MIILQRAQEAQRRAALPAVFLLPNNTAVAERDAKIATLLAQIKAYQDKALRLDRLEQITIHETDNIHTFQKRFNCRSETRVAIHHNHVTVITR